MGTSLNTHSVFHGCRLALMVLITSFSLWIPFLVGFCSVFYCSVSGLMWMALWLHTVFSEQDCIITIQLQLLVVRWKDFLSISHSLSFSFMTGYFLWAVEFCHAALYTLLPVFQRAVFRVYWMPLKMMWLQARWNGVNPRNFQVLTTSDFYKMFWRCTLV